MAETRLSDIKEETSVDLDDAENGIDPELEKSIKQLFEAAKRGWVLFRIFGSRRIIILSGNSVKCKKLWRSTNLLWWNCEIRMGTR